MKKIGSFEKYIDIFNIFASVSILPYHFTTLLFKVVNTFVLSKSAECFAYRYWVSAYVIYQKSSIISTFQVLNNNSSLTILRLWVKGKQKTQRLAVHFNLTAKIVRWVDLLAFPLTLIETLFYSGKKRNKDRIAEEEKGFISFSFSPILFLFEESSRNTQFTIFC